MRIKLNLVNNKTRYHEIIKKYRSKGYEVTTYHWRICELKKANNNVIIRR